MLDYFLRRIFAFGSLALPSIVSTSSTHQLPTSLCSPRCKHSLKHTKANLNFLSISAQAHRHMPRWTMICNLRKKKNKHHALTYKNSQEKKHSKTGPNVTCLMNVVLAFIDGKSIFINYANDQSQQQAKLSQHHEVGLKLIRQSNTETSALWCKRHLSTASSPPARPSRRRMWLLAPHTPWLTHAKMNIRLSFNKK